MIHHLSTQDTTQSQEYTDCLVVVIKPPLAGFKKRILNKQQFDKNLLMEFKIL